MSLRRRGLGTLVARMVTSASFPPAQVEPTTAPALLRNLELARAAVKGKAQRFITEFGHRPVRNGH